MSRVVIYIQIILIDIWIYIRRHCFIHLTININFHFIFLSPFQHWFPLIIRIRRITRPRTTSFQILFHSSLFFPIIDSLFHNPLLFLPLLLLLLQSLQLSPNLLLIFQYLINLLNNFLFNLLFLLFQFILMKDFLLLGEIILLWVLDILVLFR
jgi:hypothetical protein